MATKRGVKRSLRVRITVRPSRDGQWYWVAKGFNGEAMATSETYTRKFDALRGAKRFAGPKDQIVDFETGAHVQ